MSENALAQERLQNVHEFREWRNNLLVMSNGETNPTCPPGAEGG